MLVVGVEGVIFGRHLVTKVAIGASFEFAARCLGFILNLPLRACGGKAQNIGNEKNG